MEAVERWSELVSVLQQALATAVLGLSAARRGRAEEVRACAATVRRLLDEAVRHVGSRVSV